MPISARMSLWGLYRYDNTILDGLTVPTGMDADNVKQNLLLETAGMSILYPDPDFLKTVISLWAAERKDVWDKLYETTVLQYDPIENYDRIEETEESAIGVSVKDATQTRKTASSDIAVKDSSQSKTNETSESAAQNSGETVTESVDKENNTSNSRHQNGSSTTTNANTAYNSATFADTAQATSSGEDQVSDVGTGEEKTVRDYSSDIRSDSVRNASGTESLSGSDRESKNGSSDESFSGNDRESRNDNRRISSRVHGNIGVTSSQQLIEAQREVVQFCMTEYIINDFIQRFCVMVY